MRWVWDLGQEPAPAASVPGLEVRLLPVQGVSVAAGIMARTWTGYFTREEAAEFLRRARDQGQLLPFVAYLDGQPAGSALVIIRGRSAQLFGGVHVLPAHRRRGVGVFVLRSVLRHLRSLGLGHLYVTRDIADPPSPDDVAAMALYDRSGGIRQKPLVEIVYSPQCPWCFEWLEAFRDELAGADVDFRALSLHDDADKAWPMLLAAGVAQPAPDRKGSGTGAKAPVLTENLYAAVFVDGVRLSGDGFPLPAGLLTRAVRRALGHGASPRSPGPLAAGATPGPAVEDFLAPRPDVRPPAVAARDSNESGSYSRTFPDLASYASALEGLEAEPLIVSSPEDALAMCLGNHPSGSRPRPSAATRGAAAKTRWLASLDLPGGLYGVGARKGGEVVGLIEVYPRLVAAGAGYVTGTWGDPQRTLTITCIEVASGMARHPAMEFLLESLLGQLSRHRGAYQAVEAVGRYGNMAGFNPYWLFDKYGFIRREERRPGLVILSRDIG
ncbi:MAG: GNAT family N-acetyltransferase [Bacillota bacterium]|nr:MAG: GNAT family N-acetyltransferase [Bacillota bacterium]